MVRRDFDLAAAVALLRHVMAAMAILWAKARPACGGGDPCGNGTNAGLAH
jgi:hypothetical protein